MDQNGIAERYHSHAPYTPHQQSYIPSIFDAVKLISRVPYVRENESVSYTHEYFIWAKGETSEMVDIQFFTPQFTFVF